MAASVESDDFEDIRAAVEVFISSGLLGSHVGKLALELTDSRRRQARLAGRVVVFDYHDCRLCTH